MTSTGAKNKRDGAAWEIALVNHFRDRGLEADRLRLSGAKDEGDIAVRDQDGRVAFIVEAKAGKNVRPRAWFDEAKVEAKHYADARSMLVQPVPVLAMKAHGKGTGEALAVIKLADFLDLVGAKP